MIRIRRAWILPAAMLTLAFAALSLLALPLEAEVSRRAPPPPPRPVVATNAKATSLSVERPSSSVQRPAAPARPPANPSPPPVVVRTPAKPVRFAPKRVTLPGVTAPRPEKLRATLDREDDFIRRLAILDAFVAATPEEPGTAALEDLLDRLPRTSSPEDQRRHRVEILIRLGEYPGCRSERCLLTVATTLEATKEERLAALAAIEQQGVRSESTSVVESLAEGDPDLDVRRAAARALLFPRNG